MSNNPNTYENQKLRGLKRKYEIIMSRGGKCEVCGYDKNIAVLEFHHINPDEKEFQLDMRKFSNTTLEKLQKEIDKCMLLCVNCHRELHHPELAFNNIEHLIKNSNKESFNNPSGQVCPVCGKRFPISKGKVYCSNECKDSVKYKNYPTIEEVEQRYLELNNWEKVAESFGLTRRIIQGIRKRANK